MLAKKYIQFTLYTVLIANINMPVNGMRITQPYTPGNHSQFQKPVNATRSLLLNVNDACTMVDKETPLVGINRAFQAGILATIPSIKNRAAYYLIDSLLTNPMETLAIVETRYVFFENEKTSKMKECQNLDQQIQVFKSTVQKYKNSFPLLLLAECPSPCPLSREDHPHLRRTFEQKVSDLLIDKITLNPTKTVHYVSFGSGGAFAELIVAAKALAKIPNANLHIHLIDLQYACYVAIKERICTSHKITSSQNIKLDDLLNVINQHQQNFSINALFEKFKKDSIIRFISLEERFKQFIQLLQYTFPNATIRLSIHSSKNNYYSCFKQNNFPSPNVISAADILDSNGHEKEAHIDFVLLCLEALHNDDNASNLWLERNYFTENFDPGLITTSLEKLNDNSVAMESDSGEIFAYKTVESL